MCARGAKGNWCQKSEIETLSYGEKCDLTLREMAIACDSDIVRAGKAGRERETETERERQRQRRIREREESEREREGERKRETERLRS